MPNWLRALLCCGNPKKRATAFGGDPPTITASSHDHGASLPAMSDGGPELWSPSARPPARADDPGSAMTRAYHRDDARPAIFECGAAGDRPTQTRVTMLPFTHPYDYEGSVKDRLALLGQCLDRTDQLGAGDDAGTLPILLAPEGFLSNQDGGALTDKERRDAFKRIAQYSKEHPGVLIIPGTCYFRTKTQVFNVVPVFYGGELQCVYCKRWPGGNERIEGLTWGTLYPDASKDTRALFRLRGLTFATEVCNDYRRNHVLRFYDEHVEDSGAYPDMEGVDVHILPSLGVLPETDWLSTYTDKAEGATKEQRVIKFTHSRARKGGYFLHCDAGASGEARPDEAQIKATKCTVHRREGDDADHTGYTPIPGTIQSGSGLISFGPFLFP
ncbi:hypothetical protein WME90_43655 [Sorangium sp. So ce375]|uniref:hypothetical protein n=1 Tax=Sorangium sp. So ce375 TaxID=3133306 RepID=UPI003F5B41BF